MSNKLLTVWLILLTAFIVWTAEEESDNKQLRNKYRVESIEDRKVLKNNVDSLYKYINGDLRKELDEIHSWLHKHK